MKFFRSILLIGGMALIGTSLQSFGLLPAALHRLTTFTATIMTPLIGAMMIFYAFTLRLAKPTSNEQAPEPVEAAETAKPAPQLGKPHRSLLERAAPFVVLFMLFPIVHILIFHEPSAQVLDRQTEALLETIDASPTAEDLSVTYDVESGIATVSGRFVSIDGEVTKANRKVWFTAELHEALEKYQAP